MFSKLDEAIIKTLCYHDLFDYPLRPQEISRWLIKYTQKLSERDFLSINKNSLVLKRKGFYCLTGREKIIGVRKQREIYSKDKSILAGKFVDFLKYIPGIKLVGITGALAMENAKKQDDIDLFIITGANFLWTTRFIVTSFFELLGIRRQPSAKTTNNKICLNMYLDENNLSLPEAERDIYLAHEILQMKPLIAKGDIYRKFIQANIWIKKYLPHAINYSLATNKIKRHPSFLGHLKDLVFNNIWVIFYPFEIILRITQIWYMTKRKTIEIVGNGMIKFHPHDARNWVISGYRQNLRRIKINDSLT